MVASGPSLGFVFTRNFPAAEVVPYARATEAAGFDDLWVIEDCFYTTAPTLGAAALASTGRLTVGIGIMPAAARNAAITAMEFATLAELAPGRVIAGLGHGVYEWMKQIGESTPSQLGRLDEVTSAVRRLLHGETVSVEGPHVRLDAVRLDVLPSSPPPVLLGVRGPRSLQLAGRVADGVVLAELAGPTYVRWSREQAGGDPLTVVYTCVHVDDDRMAARRRLAGFMVEMLAQPNIALRTAPGLDAAVAAAAEGEEAVVHLPDAWWREVAAVGDPDDVAAHVAGLVDAGADRVCLLPVPHLDVAREQLARLSGLLPGLRDR